MSHQHHTHESQPEAETLKLNVSRRFNVQEGHRIVDIDRARIEAIKRGFAAADRLETLKAAVAPSSFPITNAAVTYTTAVGIGSPPTDYTLLIDTGSSNTWIGADKKYVHTSTSKRTNNKFHIQFGSGRASGIEYTDTVTLSPNLVIKNQSIGVANSTEGFRDVDGILGVGPVDLTRGTLDPSENAEIPTVTDNLLAQGKISTEVLGIYFQTSPERGTVNGELTFGGYDQSKTTGDVLYAPITDISPASNYWGITQSINYGENQILSSTGGIVDTGTTLVYLATDAFKSYLAATGGAVDKTTGLIKIPEENVSSMESLFFNIGGKSLELTANAQLWPRSLNRYIGGDAHSRYSVVTDIGNNTGEGLDFINGYTFLERFYTIYDTSNKRVGFAPTAHTFDTTN